MYISEHKSYFINWFDKVDLGLINFFFNFIEKYNISLKCNLVTKLFYITLIKYKDKISIKFN